ncbi:DUF3014 domain-containing protein [Pigmentiphaga sp. GD03639]|uniref:DUF3014 domain-containing protein n=1 Tax=unclassified Pigmentiphaga TaxID=2626614 RepID=UPI000B409EEF|nr:MULTISPECIES: DUF3014 domain-containing protein [unclassified Pigmentiphaga]MDH2239659.1 DUF3014 domain-containing protein [Pigmentiphaga sp. GD03639]OVZ63275.1 hypothetical protein CDO46_13520 [Pigmentiphaga sp. NML030171]
MNRLSSLVVVLALAAIGTGLYLWLRPQPEPPASVAESPPAAAESAEPPAPPPPEPEIQHPIEPPPAAETAEPPAAPDITVAMTGLLGRDAVLSFFNLDHFIQRAVATVDNLARPHAPPRVWPVNPTQGRFAVEGAAPGERIAAANYNRYRPFVAAVTAVGTDKAAALYKQLYPQFQKAYEDLGYPRGYFNDRLVAVIDTLLATPDPAEPVAVNLPEVKGPKELQRPWVSYEYSDPALESLTSGQKILLRMGPDNRRALKAKLADFRRHVTQSMTR